MPTSTHSLPGTRVPSAGLIAVLGGITMLFTAFTSAYIVRRGLSSDWLPLSFPAIFLASPLLLLTGSFILDIGFRKFPQSNQFKLYCWVTTLLGVAFLFLQFYTWNALHRTVSVVTYPAAAFFYVISGAFAVFVLGGMVALIRIGIKSQPSVSETEVYSRAKSAVYYWHYLNALWIYLWAVLLFWK